MSEIDTWPESPDDGMSVGDFEWTMARARVSLVPVIGGALWSYCPSSKGKLEPEQGEQLRRLGRRQATSGSSCDFETIPGCG